MRSSRLRSLLGGPASAALLLLMLAGCLFLWVGAPVLWLWIGSQVQGSASLGTAMLVTFAGFVATVLVVVTGLSWLNRAHAELQEVRQRPVSSQSALEVMFVASAGIAVAAFVIWFFFLAGASPIPVEIGF
jgi:uncharacterized membrane protein YbhN (UPF0104 family)